MPPRPAWWSEPFAYEQLLPQWPDQTAVLELDGTSQVVAAASVARVGAWEVTTEQSTDGARLVSVRDGECAVEFACSSDDCDPVTRTWFDGARVAGYDFLVETGEAWARFINEYRGDGFYVATWAVLPDGKLDAYATRAFDEDRGQVLLLYPANGCGHELTVDASLRPVRAVGYCQQQLTEEEEFRYDGDTLVEASVRYGAHASPIAYRFEWADDVVTLTASVDGRVMRITPGADVPEASPDLLERASRLCEQGQR